MEGSQRRSWPGGCLVTLCDKDPFLPQLSDEDTSEIIGSWGFKRSMRSKLLVRASWTKSNHQCPDPILFFLFKPINCADACGWEASVKVISWWTYNCAWHCMLGCLSQRASSSMLPHSSIGLAAATQQLSQGGLLPTQRSSKVILGLIPVSLHTQCQDDLRGWWVIFFPPSQWVWQTDCFILLPCSNSA